jgi:hypothetical protein
MRRTYSLELKATIFGLGEDFKCKVHCPNVTLYSARPADGLKEAGRSVGIGAVSLGLVQKEGLPGYEEDAGMERGREQEPLPVYERLMSGNT